MSNKTQLQTNNTNLASLIESLRGKAAGGGSDSSPTGGIGPMCTVEIVANAPVANTTFNYLASDLSKIIDTKTASQIMSGISLSVPAYTPISADPILAAQPSGGAINMGGYCYYITDDAVLTII